MGEPDPDDERQEADVEGYADGEAAQGRQPSEHCPLIPLGIDHPLQAPLHMEQYLS